MNREDNLKPFKPGESGNPNGRPLGSKNRSTIAKKWLEIEIDEINPLTGEIEKLSLEDLITLQQIKQAKGTTLEPASSAYKALMDSAYGAPKQEVDNKVSGAINIISLGSGLPPDETPS